MWGFLAVAATELVTSLLVLWLFGDNNNEYE